MVLIEIIKKEDGEHPQAVAGRQKLQIHIYIRTQDFLANSCIVRKKVEGGAAFIKNNDLCTLSHYSSLQFNKVRIILIFIAKMRKQKL